MLRSKDSKTEEASNMSNIISKNTTIIGNIETEGNLRIEGIVKGTIISKSKVVLGESSILEGDLIAQNAEIAGSITGKIQISEILILKSTSKVYGDTITEKIVIESGAIFNGNCSMDTDKVKNIHLKFEREKLQVNS